MGLTDTIKKILRESKTPASLLAALERLPKHNQNDIETVVKMFALGETSNWKAMWACAARAKSVQVPWIKGMTNIAKQYASYRSQTQSEKLVRLLLAKPESKQRTLALAAAYNLAILCGSNAQALKESLPKGVLDQKSQNSRDASERKAMREAENELKLAGKILNKARKHSGKILLAFSGKPVELHNGITKIPTKSRTGISLSRSQKMRFEKLQAKEKIFLKKYRMALAIRNNLARGKSQ
jgi:hypothetical protein